MTNSNITLFDFHTPGDPRELGSPSPFGWRVRLSLHYKKLPYTTIWGEVDEMESTCKAHDIPLAPGATTYTFPCIIDRTDPNNVVRLMDSDNIVQYLDRAYPDPPLKSSDERTKSVEQICERFNALVGLLVMRWVVNTFPPKLLAMHERMAPKRFGMTFQEAIKAGGEVGSSIREGHWEKVRQDFEELALKAGDKWLDGEEEPKYKDFVVLSFIRLVYICEYDDGWAKLTSWSGGKWKRYWEASEPYMYQQ